MGSNLQEIMTHTTIGAAVPKDGSGFVTGVSAAMLLLESVLAELAPTSIPILLVGEIGTGKKTFAQHIHRRSARRDQVLRKIACASLKDEAFSTELGLHAKGTRSEGENLIGTLVFDEISELSPACQRNLLYALPEEEAHAIPGQVRARVISTTNKNLDEETRAGRFRSELFYRINGVCLRLPPLRERKEDIARLADFFLAKHAARFGRARVSLSAQTLQILSEHRWPGNIRELENVVKKIVALGDDRMALSEFSVVPSIGRPSAATAAAAGTRTNSLKAAARAASREAERELILKALARTRWNRKKAAQDLQISYKSLLYKLKQIGLPETGLGE